MDFKLRVTQRTSKIWLPKVTPTRMLQMCQTLGKAQAHPLHTKTSSELQPLSFLHSTSSFSFHWPVLLSSSAPFPPLQGSHVILLQCWVFALCKDIPLPPLSTYFIPPQTVLFTTPAYFLLKKVHFSPFS